MGPARSADDRPEIQKSVVVISGDVLRDEAFGEIPQIVRLVNLDRLPSAEDPGKDPHNVCVHDWSGLTENKAQHGVG